MLSILFFIFLKFLPYIRTGASEESTPSLTVYPRTTFPPSMFRFIVDNMNTRGSLANRLRIPKRKRKQPVIPMYPCGNCGTMCYRTWALSHAGYCEACEWMTAEDVQRYTLMTRQTMTAHEFRAQWHTVRIGARLLYHRADVEQTKAHRAEKNKGWSSLMNRVA